MACVFGKVCMLGLFRNISLLPEFEIHGGQITDFIILSQLLLTQAVHQMLYMYIHNYIRYIYIHKSYFVADSDAVTQEEFQNWCSYLLKIVWTIVFLSILNMTKEPTPSVTSCGICETVSGNGKWIATAGSCCFTRRHKQVNGSLSTGLVYTRPALQRNAE